MTTQPDSLQMPASFGFFQGTLLLPFVRIQGTVREDTGPAKSFEGGIQLLTQNK